MNRPAFFRRFKRITVLFVALLPLVAGCGLRQPASNRYEGSFLDVFDTVTTVILYDTDRNAAQQKIDEIHNALLRYHRLYDIYHEYEGIHNLCTVNNNAGVAPVSVEPPILELLQFAKEAYDRTGGRMNVAMGSVLSLWHDCREAGIQDPEHAVLPDAAALLSAGAHTDIGQLQMDEAAGTVYLPDPDMRLDVGAVAKGYAAQRVMEQMAAQGVENLLLSVGGNVCGIGRRGDGKDWKVGVQSPDGAGYLCYVKIENASLVTSGTYQRYYTVDGKRYHHIIDPDTRMPSDRYVSVSVLCSDSGLADALSTALFNMSLSDGLALIDSLPDTEALWVTPDGTQTQSSGFSDFLLPQ